MRNIFLASHENTHQDHAQKAGKEIEAAILAVKPASNCEDLGLAAIAVAEAIAAKFQALDLEFDRKTGHGLILKVQPCSGHGLISRRSPVPVMASYKAQPCCRRHAALSALGRVTQFFAPRASARLRPAAAVRMAGPESQSMDAQPCKFSDAMRASASIHCGRSFRHGM